MIPFIPFSIFIVTTSYPQFGVFVGCILLTICYGALIILHKFNIKLLPVTETMAGSKIVIFSFLGYLFCLSGIILSWTIDFSISITLLIFLIGHCISWMLLWICIEQ
jgi:hypothetical protein